MCRNLQIPPNFNMTTTTGSRRRFIEAAAAAAVLHPLAGRGQEVGLAGIAPVYHNPEILRDTLAALDQRKLKMFAVYVPLELDSPAPVSPAIRDVIEQLRGRDAILWLYVNFTAHKSSDPAGDAKAVPVMREVADLAKQAAKSQQMIP